MTPIKPTRDGKICLTCFECGKMVTTPFIPPKDFILRGTCTCPECEKKKGPEE